MDTVLRDLDHQCRLRANRLEMALARDVESLRAPSCLTTASLAQGVSRLDGVRAALSRIMDQLPATASESSHNARRNASS